MQRGVPKRKAAEESAGEEQLRTPRLAVGVVGAVLAALVHCLRLLHVDVAAPVVYSLLVLGAGGLALLLRGGRERRRRRARWLGRAWRRRRRRSDAEFEAPACGGGADPGSADGCFQGLVPGQVAERDGTEGPEGTEAQQAHGTGEV